eukprot:5418184-Pleurochrysis_carterae.AAC.4
MPTHSFNMSIREHEDRRLRKISERELKCMQFCLEIDVDFVRNADDGDGSPIVAQLLVPAARQSRKREGAGE